MMKLKSGDQLMIGDTLIVIKETKSFQVGVGIRAKRQTIIQKL